MGIGLSLIIGFVTFTVGVSLFPVEMPRPPAPPPRAPLAAPPVAPSPPPPSGSDAGSDAGRVDGAAGGGSDLHKGDTSSTDAAAPAAAAPASRRSKTSRNKEKEPTDASADEEPKTRATGAGGAGGESGENGDSGESGATTASGDDADGGTPVAPPADCTLPDRDIAREAWRHNWPTICPIPDSRKAFIIIPVKGSIENAVAELKRKPVREARVTVSSGESLLTLKVYKLRRLGFKDLKIGPGDDGTGTRFRVRLMNGAGDPVFDVKDGYAKITVASPPE